MKINETECHWAVKLPNGLFFADVDFDGHVMEHVTSFMVFNILANAKRWANDLNGTVVPVKVSI
jgi:hypothetical protein